MRQHARDPIRHWITDSHGEVRIGWGFSGTTISYWARLDGDSDWRRLTRFAVFTRENQFEPVAISAEDPNMAYALGPSEGRRAVWLIDLKDKEDPKLGSLARPRGCLGPHAGAGQPADRRSIR